MSRFAPLLLALTGACASATGVGTGALEPSRTGRPETVDFAWSAEPSAARGTIEAALPDGERFRGSWIRLDARTDPGVLAAYFRAFDGGWMGLSAPAFARAYEGDLVALLDGPHEKRMRCRFQLAHPERGLAAGGLGSCELTDGHTVEYAELRGR
jgi:hypothetical protein